MKKAILYCTLTMFIISGCVTPKIHNTLVGKHEETSRKLKQQDKKVIELTAILEEKTGVIERIKSKIKELQNDSIQNGNAVKVLQSKYDQLSQTYDLLASKNSRYIADKAKETKKLLEQLDQSQSELFEQQDKLNTLSASLDDKKQELKRLQQDLEDRAKRVAELEQMISKKDSIVKGLKRSISKALIGLEGDGLTIVQKNGKVYISLEEDLLFASGKYSVNSGGIIALNKLASALGGQKDLEILIEGHTDSIPLSGKGLVKDNWDLSVMRATNVVKVLTKNPTLSPSQFTAAGRAEFLPINSNKTIEGRGANRRIEIILSPNLDDLFELLEE